MKKIITIAISTLLLATSLAPANAATEKGWRYWGYFQAAPGAANWSYALTGPAGSTPGGFGQTARRLCQRSKKSHRNAAQRRTGCHYLHR